MHKSESAWTLPITLQKESISLVTTVYSNHLSIDVHHTCADTITKQHFAATGF